MNTTVDGTQPTETSRKAVWLRGLYMLFFVIAFGLVQSIVNLIALVQFVSMLVFNGPNEQLARFGASLGMWLSEVAAFQAGSTENKPFPWGEWPQEK
ncbi:MAG: DUF4389 domain-containing protein [Pseudomonadota bacterium]